MKSQNKPKADKNQNKVNPQKQPSFNETTNQKGAPNTNNAPRKPGRA